MYHLIISKMNKYILIIKNQIINPTIFFNSKSCKKRRKLTLFFTNKIMITFFPAVQNFCFEGCRYLLIKVNKEKI